VGLGLRTGLANFWGQMKYRTTVLGKLGGVVERTCPLCGTKGRFRAFGHPPRYDAECPGCTSLERHRLLHLAMESEGALWPEAEVLHFAPELAIRSYIKSRVARYVTADLEADRGDIALNLENIALPDGSFDIVIANHVLEHVNDKASLSELHRILRPPHGLLIATVPLVEGWDTTYENDRVASAADREVHYGQWDHVRFYGRDFRDRIRAAGFDLSEFTATGEEVVRFGLLRGERVFFARKGAALRTGMSRS
jgi:SAM-dependent methyltransferase